MLGSLLKRKVDHPTIFLHIGMNKTGSTALQNYLSQAQPALKGAGISYAETGRIGSAHYALSTSLGFCNPSVPSQWKWELENLRKLFLKESQGGERKIIFSSEDFLLNRSFEKFKKFFEGFDVKVIVYLRRHDHWWLSAYAQAVKMKYLPPWNQGPLGFINFNRRRNRYYGDYRHLIDRWAEAIGKENIIVRPYEASQNIPNLAADFLAAIGEGGMTSELPAMMEHYNSSLPSSAIQMMDIIQRVRATPDIHEKLLNHARNFDNGNSRPLRDMVNPQFLLNLVNSYQDDYSYIAKEYLGREDGVLFYEPLPEVDSDWKPLKWPSQAEVAEEVLKITSSEL